MIQQMLLPPHLQIDIKEPAGCNGCTVRGKNHGKVIRNKCSRGELGSIERELSSVECALDRPPTWSSPSGPHHLFRVLKSYATPSHIAAERCLRPSVGVIL